MRLRDLLREDRISTDLRGEDRDDVIEELLGLLAGATEIGDHEEFAQSIEAREDIESTGIGNGIGIPHGITDAVKSVVCAFGVSKTGVDYPSMDGKPVQIVFLLGVPKEEAREYLSILARICRCFRDGRLRKAIVDADSPRKMIELIGERDEQEP
jgi:fructose-specific phosphotransferase system IIA component